MRKAGFRGDGAAYVGDHHDDSSDESLVNNKLTGEFQLLNLIKEGSQSKNVSLTAPSDFGDFADGSGKIFNIEKV